MALNIHEKGVTISKTKLVGEKLKYEPFSASKLLFWRQKWVIGVLHGNSLIVRRVSPGRIIVVLFWTKYAVPRQIKPGILKLTTRKGQRNLCTVFIFVICEEKGCYRYRIVSLGHQNFDCRSYCGLSRRMPCYIVVVEQKTPQDQENHVIALSVHVISSNLIWNDRWMLRF